MHGGAGLTPLRTAHACPSTQQITFARYFSIARYFYRKVLSQGMDPTASPAALAPSPTAMLPPATLAAAAALAAAAGAVFAAQPLDSLVLPLRSLPLLALLLLLAVLQT